MALTDKQNGVLRGMVAAVATVALVLGAAILLRPELLLPVGSSLEGRLAWAVAWLLLPGFCLVVAIGRLANHRFRTPEDIDGSGLTAGTETARINQAVIQNTLEQAVLATIVYGAYASLLARGWQAALPAAAVLFAIGRALFAAGYRRGAGGRALGFALTFYPTVVLAVIAAVAAILRILGL